MGRNRIRITSRHGENLRYDYYDGKNRGWKAATADLALPKFTRTTIAESALPILTAINKIYNRASRGTDIFFDGPGDEYRILQTVLQQHFPDSGIVLQGKAKIAVAGKSGAGKTKLIEAIGRQRSVEYETQESEHYVLRFDCGGSANWYELTGIDFGQENIKQIPGTLKKLYEGGVTALIYCIGTNRIEPLEVELLQEIHSQIPQFQITIALTQCIYEKPERYIAQLQERLDFVHVFPLLAETVKTTAGEIEPYGLKELASAVL